MTWLPVCQNKPYMNWAVSQEVLRTLHALPIDQSLRDWNSFIRLRLTIN